MIKYYIFDDEDAFMLYLTFIKKDIHFFYHFYSDSFDNSKIHEFCFSETNQKIIEKICNEFEIIIF